MTTPEWYITWATAHVATFGLREQCEAMMLSWGPVWSRLYAAEELYDATRRMTADPAALRFAGDHRPAILSHVGRHRERTTRAEQNRTANVAANGTCQVCGGGGMVVVPHPGIDPHDDNRKRWTGYMTVPTDEPGSKTDRRLIGMTAAVCCVCDAGKRSMQASAESGRPSLDIIGFEQRYPNWPAVAAERTRLVNLNNGVVDLPTPEEAAAAVAAVKSGVGRRHDS